MAPRLGRMLLRGMLALIAGSAVAPAPTSANDLDPREVLEERCSACHTARPDGGFERISDVRKTPEGWEMTIVRMGIWHGVEVPNDELSLLVRHLADTQGLAPSETAGRRYILERQPNVVESFPNRDVEIICARCHSHARVALQRRDEDEWRKLAHAHLGQYPTTEYQALGRDRDWWGIARDKMPKMLGNMFPLKTDAWDGWRDREKSDPSGAWRVYGERGGVGRYTGTAEITKSDRDRYDVKYDLRYADGTQVPGEGTALVYTGFEWRGSSKLGAEEVREVFALNESGNAIDGRWFLASADEVGASFHAVRMSDAAPGIVAVEPPLARAGVKTTLTVHGFGLNGDVALGNDVEILETVSASATAVTVMVMVSPDAAAGRRKVTVGDASADGLFSVYTQIDSIRVEPPFAISRVGGGTTPAVVAQFTAVAYLNGPDGKAGTADDARLGSVPAQWSVENFNQDSEAMEDVKYVGVMDQNGTFHPAAAGPNPERKYRTNNAGRVTVKAVIDDGGREVVGVGEMVVTVQRWNTPPIL